MITLKLNFIIRDKYLFIILTSVTLLYIVVSRNKHLVNYNSFVFIKKKSSLASRGSENLLSCWST